jgi:hypothetical protein
VKGESGNGRRTEGKRKEKLKMKNADRERKVNEVE